ncbi:MAG: type I asparaginase [Bacteroidota bacterium]|nr:type I asparaginase [Bacteroidota bacterium]
MAKLKTKTSSKPGSRILIIYTGGTIGMIQDHESGVLSPIDFSQIRREVPEIKKFGYAIEVVSFDPVLDSSDMQPAHWIKMAELIRDHYIDFDGFVILHGSDTLAYTASALSFMLENLAKPVILTGSQLPVGEIRTDARENLITAIEIAATRFEGKAAVPEVCVYFDYFLFRGNRTTKMNSAKFEAFQSVNFPPLAEAGVHLKFNRHLIIPANGKKLKTHSVLNNQVGVIRIFPGMTREWFESQLNAKNIKAIILETFGSGNAPSQGWFIEELQKACDRGMVIVNISQCPGGAVEQGRYATSSKLAKMGVIGGGDLTLEAALSKLNFLLGKTNKFADIKQLMGKSLRGELTI